ncbi:MAG: coenzyme F420 hydrogenase/dehydrogenase beta subunit N-terminal domain-containing protein, partial [Methanothrix sp.]|nr:coenzyme F420 hydrogenase/dehydrogenase beta subunit N-terminal domain-containing protein [Methanothrix sp.]
MAAKERYAEPTYLECGFGELEHRVIGREICCGCGTCEAFCPRIEHRESRPALVDYDPLCGLCYAYCPRTFLDMGEMERRLFGRTREAAEPLGVYRRVASARARERQSRAQDGGVVTALLVQALESGTIDCAVVTDRDEDWRTLPRVATSPEEVISAAGTKYTVSNSVVAVAEAIERGFRRIGFVGTPCQIQALRKTQLVEEPYEIGQRRISLLIGLFCMENFGYQDLMDGLVRGRFGLDPKEVARFEIKRGMFRALDSTGGVHEVRL